MTGKNYDLLDELKENATENASILWPKLTEVQHEISSLEKKLIKNEEKITRLNNLKAKYSKFLNLYSLFVIVPVGIMIILKNLLNVGLLNEATLLLLKVTIIPTVLVVANDVGNSVSRKLSVIEIERIKGKIRKKEKQKFLLSSYYKKENNDSINAFSVLDDYNKNKLSSFEDGFFTDIDFSNFSNDEFSRILSQIATCSTLLKKDNLTETELYNLKKELILLSNLLKTSNVDNEVCSKLVQTDKILSRKLENKRN